MVQIQHEQKPNSLIKTSERIEVYHEISAEEIDALVESLFIGVGLAEFHVEQRDLLRISGVFFAQFRVIAAQLFLEIDQLFESQTLLAPQHLQRTQLSNTDTVKAQLKSTSSSSTIRRSWATSSSRAMIVFFDCSSRCCDT